MIEVCDPDANISDLKRLIKLNTGHEIKLTKNQICQVYDDIKSDRLPLPPLILSSDKTYLTDKKSPLKPRDYDVLFDSTSKKSDLKRIAHKVGFKPTGLTTKNQIIDSIGKRLRYMNVYEPIKIGRKASLRREKNTFNNVSTNNFNTNTNNLNTNTNTNNFNTNANTNNLNTNANTNNKPNNNIFTKSNTQANISIPRGSVFRTKPKFLQNQKVQNFIVSNKFVGSKSGYVFKTGNRGTGYYLNSGSPKTFGPSIPSVANVKPEPGFKFPSKLFNRNVKPTFITNNKKNTSNVGTGTNNKKNTSNAGTGTNNKKNTSNVGTGTNNKKNTSNEGTGTNNKKNTSNVGTGTNNMNTIRKNREADLLKIPNVDISYLKSYLGSNSVMNVNKNNLKNKVNKDRLIRNLRNTLSPPFYGKSSVKYVDPNRYENIKNIIENKISSKNSDKLLRKLSLNAKVSKEYVKKFADGTPYMSVSLNSLKIKRNKDLEVYKLNTADKKTIFGFNKKVNTTTMKFIPNSEYNKRLETAKLELERKREEAAKKKKNNNQPTPNKKNNNNQPVPNKQLNIEANRQARNQNEKNFNASAELNKQLNIEANRQARNQNEKNFNASAELNKQLNIESNRQARNQNEKNFNASAELNKQLNTEATRQKNEANQKRRNEREKEKKNLLPLLNKLSSKKRKMYLTQINKPNTNLRPLRALINANISFEKKQGEVLNKTRKHVAKFRGIIGDWKPAINGTKTIKELNMINANLNRRIELRGEINMSKMSPKEKREMSNMLMRYKSNSKQVRRNFEKILNNIENKKISNVTKPLVGGIINNMITQNKAATKIQAGFRGKKGRNTTRRMKFEKNTNISEVFNIQEPTNSNLIGFFDRGSAISTINRLKKISSSQKTIFKGRIGKAKTKTELENIKREATRSDEAMKKVIK